MRRDELLVRGMRSILAKFMKDSVVRGCLLQLLYERRSEGSIQFGHAEQEKNGAKSLLRKLLGSKAAASVLGAGAQSLAAKYFTGIAAGPIRRLNCATLDFGRPREDQRDRATEAGGVQWCSA